MTYTWSYLQKNPQEAKRLLGINYPDLMKLIELAKTLDKKHTEKVEQQKTRLIRAGGGAFPQVIRGRPNTFDTNLSSSIPHIPNVKFTVSNK